jgi:hypothetical protein
MDGIVNRQLFRKKIDGLSDLEAAEVLEYIAIMQSFRRVRLIHLPRLSRGFCDDSMVDGTFERGSIRRLGLKNRV